MTQISTLMTAGAVALSASSMAGQPAAAKFGPDNPFYAPSTLPFHAPPFDKIKDADYLPAIEAGMEQQLEETRAIADNKAEPTFENTIVAMEKTGQLYDRVMAAFSGVTGANTNPVLQDVRSKVAPKRAAMSDAIYLNDRLFARVSKVYEERNAQHLDPESLRLVEEDYKHFVRAGARLSEADKATLKKMNEEIANLSTAFSNKLLADQGGGVRHHGQVRAGGVERRATVCGGAGCEGSQSGRLGAGAAEYDATTDTAIAEQSGHAAGVVSGFLGSR
jgi:peptidyl-dipeptidase Dcp